MAYTPTVWIDRQVQKPLTFQMNDNGDGTTTLVPVTGTVIEAGTPISADVMNNIENGILALQTSKLDKDGGNLTGNLVIDSGFSLETKGTSPLRSKLSGFKQWRFGRSGNSLSFIPSTSANGTSDDTNNDIVFSDTGEVTANRFISGKMRLLDGHDVSLTSTDHAFQIGSDTSTNIAIDNNEIMARSNGLTAPLYLNLEGGEVSIGNNTDTYNGDLALKVRGKQHIFSNGDGFQLYGNDHMFMEFFAKGSTSSRSGYMGFGSPSNNDMSISNELNGVLNLNTQGSYQVRINGHQAFDDSRVGYGSGNPSGGGHKNIYIQI